MNRILTPHYLFISAILTLTALTGNAVAQTQKVVKQTNAHPTTATTGDQLYKEFCAVCHGVDAKGNGPAASALKTNPGDLTQITRRNDNKFPDLKVRFIINGADAVGAHGNSDMPVWGDVFKSISPNQTFAQMRVDSLVKYLQTIQR
jgi:mono/diheme cytochrome c family protein